MKNLDVLETRLLASESLVAVHEAGHFVAGCVLGNESAIRISIIPDEGTLGQVLGSGTTHYEDVDAIERKVVELLAGHRAQMSLPGVSIHEALAGADDDVEHMRSLLLRLPRGREFRTMQRLRRRTDALLNDHWSIVIGIAGMLLEFEEVDADSAEEWVAWAMGSQDSNALTRALLLNPATRNTDLGKELAAAPCVDSFLRRTWESWQSFVLETHAAADALLEGIN